MTPSVASTTVVTATLLAGVSTAVHDREWWSEEAVHVGTDWYGVVEAAFKRLIAAGIIEPPAAETRTLWDTPPWHDAALEYHQSAGLPRRRDRAQAACSAAAPHGGRPFARARLAGASR
jgi:hypothetical protein